VGWIQSAQYSIQQASTRVNELEDYRTEAAKERVQDRQQLSSLEEATESLEADVDDLTNAEDVYRDRTARAFSPSS
jgi:hypothetical protein